jgi:hypothetical protein
MVKKKSFRYGLEAFVQMGWKQVADKVVLSAHFPIPRPMRRISCCNRRQVSEIHSAVDGEVSGDSPLFTIYFKGTTFRRPSFAGALPGRDTISNAVWHLRSPRWL